MSIYDPTFAGAARNHPRAKPGPFRVERTGFARPRRDFPTAEEAAAYATRKARRERIVLGIHGAGDRLGHVDEDGRLWLTWAGSYYL
jgi:hypothetical protein